MFISTTSLLTRPSNASDAFLRGGDERLIGWARPVLLALAGSKPISRREHVSW